MRCPTGKGRGQFTTVKANNSEKSKTVCNNSYIRLDLQKKKILLEQEVKGRYTPNPHISRKTQGVFNMPGQTSSVSSSYLRRGKNVIRKYVRKRVVLRFNGNITFSNKYEY